MKRNIFKLMLSVFLGLCVFAGTLFWPNFSLASGNHGKKNDQIHVHIKGGAEYVAGVEVIYKGAPLVLEKKSSRLYSITQPGDIVKPDISKIIVTRTDGSKQEFSPASDYAGIEGNGTINYWITVSKPIKASSSPPSSNHQKDNNHNNNNGNSSSTTTKNTNTTSNTNYKTVNGGKLPQTATPWYNLMALGFLSALASGSLLLRLKRRTL